MVLEICAGLLKKRDICKHGFPTSSACYGIGGVTVKPFCMNEVLCARLFKDTGGKPDRCIWKPEELEPKEAP